MQILDVTAHGRTVSNTTSGGVTAVGALSGVLTARVGWPGVWLTDGDPAALAAQEQQVKALFPDVEITDLTVTPAASQP
ncbi:hypothetical protein ACFXKY_15490 [Streptomyces canus]|uniref:hypothetical protein n=1 Tax=Streptomyces canus TaxID=58343 RepID=UPI003698A461